MTFFLQAEDAIRARTVTGVQTCALPISGLLGSSETTEHADEPRSPVPINRPMAARQRRQIGRASCRERGLSRGAVVRVKKNKLIKDKSLCVIILYSGGLGMTRPPDDRRQ